MQDSIASIAIDKSVGYQHTKRAISLVEGKRAHWSKKGFHSQVSQLISLDPTFLNPAADTNIASQHVADPFHSLFCHLWSSLMPNTLIDSII